jgi:hypothetical protein
VNPQRNSSKVYDYVARRPVVLKDLSAEELSDQRGNLQNLESFEDEEYTLNDGYDRRPSPRLFYLY